MTASQRGGPWILGVAASHNGAACLIEGQRIVAAIQEERLTRDKRAAITCGQPFRAFDAVLRAGGITAAALDQVVVAPLRAGSAARHALATQLAELGVEAPVSAVSHHLAHAAAAYALSGFEDCAVLVVDGMGSDAADLDPAEVRAIIAGEPDGREIVSIYAARGGRLQPIAKQLSQRPPPTVWVDGDHRPTMMPFTSLGVMYQSVAQQIFGGWFDAGKVMGLAPYGTARWPLEHFVIADEATGVLRFGPGVAEAFRHSDRWPHHADDYKDLAASVQSALEAAMDTLVSFTRASTGMSRLCLVGGVALNSVANERIIQREDLESVYIMPAAEDAGTAVGAAFLGLWQAEGPGRSPGRDSDIFGPVYDVDVAVTALADDPELAPLLAWEVTCDDVETWVAEALAAGKVVGWFQGGSELGPRALGQRSILLDPRRPDGKAHLNARVKHREAFRPFAPAVLEAHAKDWFSLGRVATSPFMLRVVQVHASRRAQIPAVVHVDGSARLQTVPPDGTLHGLLSAFYARTGVPMLVNTSFNVAGEPIVETPDDAARCFVATGIDVLVLGHRVFEKPVAFTR